MVYTLSGIRLPSAPFVHKLSGSTSHGDRKNTNLSCFLKKHSSSRMIFAVRSSNDSDSPSSVVAASEKVLVPGGHIDDSSSSTDILEVANTVSGDRSSSKDQLEVADILSGDAQICFPFPLLVAVTIARQLRGAGFLYSYWDSSSTSPLTWHWVEEVLRQHDQQLLDYDNMKMEGDHSTGDDINDVETTDGYSEVNGKHDSVSSAAVKHVKAMDVETSVLSHDISKEKDMVQQMSIPPPGTGQRIYEIDPLLRSYREHLDYR
ncbi:starch branching enzyme 2.1 [Actinidia rufa]|uniref:Starch branching enzyme 2.1 n=1 Tax=Actinidia rufa TaxID=165716 RepID=A0A7J0FWE9_9ERIC|nr:starch branching enzyme 2.1 [Actinidia rufa]